MTQAEQSDPIAKAVGYMRYQAEKGFESLLALMDRTGNEWASALEGMSEDQASFRPEGEWCAKEILGHVVYSNRGVNQQIAEMGGVESPREAPKLRGMGESSEELEGLPVADLRKLVAETFAETKALTRSLEKSGKLDATFTHPLFGTLNLKEWVAFQRVHAVDHIQQIEKIKADPAYPGE